MFAYKSNRLKKTFKKTAFFFRINIQFQMEDTETILKCYQKSFLILRFSLYTPP